MNLSYLVFPVIAHLGVQVNDLVFVHFQNYGRIEHQY